MNQLFIPLVGPYDVLVEVKKTGEPIVSLIPRLCLPLNIQEYVEVMYTT